MINIFFISVLPVSVVCSLNLESCFWKDNFRDKLNSYTLDVLIKGDVIKMRRVILTPFAILLLLSIQFLMLVETSAMTNSEIICVPDDFRTIQDAINNAGFGDTILVRAGTYQENIILNRSVSLVGENRDLTIVQGSTSSYVISITANEANIRNLTIKNLGSSSAGGISVSSSSVTIHSNKITGNYEGLVLYSLSSRNVISDNVIINNSKGIRLYYSTNNLFSSNLVSNNIEGVKLYYSSNNVFSGNTFSGNSLGISILTYSNYNRFYRNNFYDTIVVSGEAVAFWSYKHEGNYWADYAGQDTNNDGVGDEPYSIDGSNQDDYPLMGAFYSFSIVVKEIIYEVAFVSNSTVSGFDFRIGEETGNKMIYFNVIDEDRTIGFCRVTIPTELMKGSFIIHDGAEEILPSLLSAPNDTKVYLYFTYSQNGQILILISSKTMYLYNQLLAEYHNLLMDLDSLNASYYHLLDNYSDLRNNYDQLQQEHFVLASSYREHVAEFSENAQNLRNLIYAFAAATATFLATTIYLSKHAHTNNRSVMSED